MSDSSAHDQAVRLVKGVELVTYPDQLIVARGYLELEEQLEASRSLNLRMWNYFAGIVEGEWGAKPPYTGSFEEMNVYLGLLGPPNPARSSDA